MFPLGSISAALKDAVCVPPQRETFWGGGGGRTRAHLPEQRLVIEPIFPLPYQKTIFLGEWARDANGCHINSKSSAMRTSFV